MLTIKDPISSTKSQTKNQMQTIQWTIIFEYWNGVVILVKRKNLSSYWSLRAFVPAWRSWWLLSQRRKSFVSRFVYFGHLCDAEDAAAPLHDPPYRFYHPIVFFVFFFSNFGPKQVVWKIEKLKKKKKLVLWSHLGASCRLLLSSSLSSEHRLQIDWIEDLVEVCLH